MNTCPTDEQLHAYRDDRLDAAARATIAQHIAACEPCTAELSRLAALSGLLSSVAVPKLSQIARHRLHVSLDAAIERAAELASERGLIRVGWRLSGIAASILVVGSAWLLNANRTANLARDAGTPATPPWVVVANSAGADSESAALPTAATPVAQWYLADASAGSNAGLSDGAQ